jgi:transposase
MIEHPANCEIWSVIRFLNARNMKLADIRRQICKVYGENAISDGMVKKWVRKFNEGRDNVHDEPRSGWPAVFKGSHILRGGDTETGAPL